MNGVALWANMLIALREGVEASLVVGIIIAYLYKVGRKDILPALWVAVIVSALIPLGLGALFTFVINDAMLQQMLGTDLFHIQEMAGGYLSIFAVILVTWMIFWMGKNSHHMARSIASEAKEALEKGNAKGLIAMAALAVLREGLETAVFVWGVVKSTGTTGMIEPALGVAIGLVAAIIIGYAVYRGSSVINLRLFFTVTGYFLIFVAAGIFMYGFGDLQEAGIIPGWGTHVYDLSFIAAAMYSNPITHFIFVLLNAFFNVQHLLAPTMVQLVAWVAYLVVVLTLFTLQIKGVLWNENTQASSPLSQSAPQSTASSPAD